MIMFFIKKKDIPVEYNKKRPQIMIKKEAPGFCSKTNKVFLDKKNSKIDFFKVIKIEQSLKRGYVLV